MQLESEDWAIFKQLIKNVPCQIYAFGSRVKGEGRRFSDIDLCLMGDISDEELVLLKLAFEDSDLPVKVDVKRKSELTEAFFQQIKQDLLLIKP